MAKSQAYSKPFFLDNGSSSIDRDGSLWGHDLIHPERPNTLKLGIYDVASSSTPSLDLLEVQNRSKYLKASMASQLAASSNQTSLQLYNVDVDCPCQSGKHRKLAHTFNSKLMASAAPLQSQFLMNSVKQSAAARRFSLSSFRPHDGRPVDPAGLPCSWRGRNKKRSSTVVAAVGELSADSTTYLVAGAAAVALLGTAFPILFSRKDLCPECDGAGFVRRAAVTLRVNAARKDEAQIVCKRCNGLGKLNQIDK